MITVDISNVWGRISLSDLLSLETDISAAHSKITQEGCPAWADPEDQPEIEALEAAAGQIRSDSDVCVVVGRCLGAQAALELLRGPDRNPAQGKGDPQILFTGDNFSTRHWNQLTALLEGKDYSVIAVSRTGTDPEAAIALRSLRWMLERKYGTDIAGKRIYAVTAEEDSALCRIAQEEGWTRFPLPAGCEGPFGALSAGALLPLAVAGIDIRKLLRGAAEAAESCALHSFENPLWLYSAIRILMQRSGTAVEVLSCFEPGMGAFGRWWQQLLAEAEGQGLFPIPAVFPRDLPSLGRLIPAGAGRVFETMVRFGPPVPKCAICSQWKDLDGLGYLEDHTLDFVEEQAWQSAAEAHADSGVPLITMECGPIDEGTVGELLRFFLLAGRICAQVPGAVDPDRDGMRSYEQTLYARLGRPEPSGEASGTL